MFNLGDRFYIDIEGQTDILVEICEIIPAGIFAPESVYGFFPVEKELRLMCSRITQDMMDMSLQLYPGYQYSKDIFNTSSYFKLLPESMFSKEARYDDEDCVGLRYL